MSLVAFRLELTDPPRHVLVDGAVEALLGFSAEDFLTAKVNLKDLVHQDDALLFASLFSSDAQVKSGVVRLRLRKANGKIVCVRGRFRKDSSSGRPVTLDLQFADVRTVTEPSDAALVNSFKSLIEQTTDYIYVKNRNHVILAASTALLNLIETNGGRKELLGSTDYDNHPEGTADIYYELEEKAFADGRRSNLIHQVLRKDGSTRWIDNRKYPINGPDGEFIGIFGVAPDITDYIETQNRLLASEEQLHEAEKIAGLGNYILDIPKMQWTVSPEVAILVGSRPEQVSGFDEMWTYIHPDDRGWVAKRFEGYFRGEGSPFDLEYRVVRATDGETRWIHTRGRLEFDASGRPVTLRGTIQDVTDRKVAEATLRENEEALQEAQRIAGLGIHIQDLSTGDWSASDILREILGVGPNENLSLENWNTVVHPEDRGMVNACFTDEALRKAQQFDVIHRIVRKSDQAVRWVHGRGRVERDQSENPVKIRGIVQDITSSKEADAALRENRELLRLFIEHAPVSIAMFDREMRYLAVSRRWAQDHSAEVEKILGRSHYEVNAHVPERWRETHRRGLAGETQSVEEDRYERPDGSEEWIRWQIIPWRAADGTVGGIVMFYEDITERRRAQSALRDSQELMRLFIDRAPAALAMFDLEMRYIAVSRRWIEDYHLEGAEIVGSSHYEVVPDIPERWKAIHQRGLAGETLKGDEDRFDRADGTVQWIRWEVVPWRTGEGAVAGIVLFAEDISKQKRAEERIRLASTVFTGAREGITITNPAGTILDVNDAFTRITGYTREEVVGRNPRILKSGLQSKEFYDNMWHTLLHEGHWSGEIWNRSKSGDIYPETLAINAIRDENGKTAHYVALFSDISEIKEHEQQLEHIAHFDALTGLPNRTLFADRLRQSMAQAHRSKRALAVAHFDLDGFKAINDRYGHSMGDGLLTAMAFRMKRALREGDTLARLGGDEFAAVMLELDDEDAVKPALDRLLLAAAEEAQIGEVTLRVSASAGVTFYPQPDDVDADVLLRQAGQAMYQAKLAGGNRYFEFDPGQDLIARSRHENLEHIRKALEDRQFILHYQPQVNLRMGKLVGVEALVRWQHPERGLLPPGMFLPIIEDHPLSIELGEWVLETALNELERWQEAGLDHEISVNVGAFELQQPNFAQRLRTHLAAHPKVRPGRLVLEVLETSALDDVTQTSHVLTSCRELGVSVALDDFGIGYSSLTYLRRLPANILKIDQSFVRDMLDEPENLTILEGVIGLASAFRRDVIAEGVETAEHGLMLLQMGCEVAQGYGIARPMPGEDLATWIQSWRPDPRWANVPPVQAINRPVLYACVEHRAWLSAFEACLQGRRTTPPPLDAGQCRVGAWLQEEKQSTRGTLASIQAIETLHHELHILAAEIFASQAEGRNSVGLARLQQLHHLHEKCLNRLRNFTRTGPRRKNSRGAGPARSRSKRS